MDNAALRTQVERLTEKMKYIENRRRWNSTANEKQYLHQIRVKQLCVEDVRKQLEDHFGSRRDVPERIAEAMKICEREIDDRTEALRRTSRVSGLEDVGSEAGVLGAKVEEDKKGELAVKVLMEE